METPVGNPNVSLLPQPAVPAHIEAMRGGGNENVSLLPQPAELAPIEPMKGGEVNPIMVGGGFEAKLEIKLQPFPALDTLPEPTFVQENILPISKSDINKYNEIRYKIWVKDPNQNISEKDPNQIILPNKKNERINKGNQKLPFTIDIYDNTTLYCFFVDNFDTYRRVEAAIDRLINFITKSTTEKPIPYFIIINKTTDQIEFSNIYKKFIQFISNKKEEEEINNSIFFLFDRKPESNSIKWGSYQGYASRSFRWLEPDYFKIKYSFQGKKKIIILIPNTEVPDDIKSTDYIAFSSLSKLSQIVKFPNTQNPNIGVKAIEEIKPVSENKIFGFFHGKINNKEFWHTHRLFFYFKDDGKEDEDEEEEEETIKSNNYSLNEDEDRKEEDFVPNTYKPPQEVKEVFELKGPQPKPTTTIDLGDQSFEIRKYSSQVEEAWKAGNFTPEENQFFDSIGINKAFIENKDQDKKELVGKRAEFLKTLSLKSCLNDTDYLLSSECEFMRDFLQELIVIRQKDRLRAATSFMASMADFGVEMKKAEAEAELITKISKEARQGLKNLLDTWIPTLQAKLRQKLPVPFDQILPKIRTISLEEEPSGLAAAKLVPPFVVPKVSKTKQKQQIPSEFWSMIQGRKKQQKVEKPKLNTRKKANTNRIKPLLGYKSNKITIKK